MSGLFHPHRSTTASLMIARSSLAVLCPSVRPRVRTAGKKHAIHAVQVLVRVRASTVSQSDTHVRAADPFLYRLFAGLRRPRWRSLGAELAGEVEAVGAEVTEFKVGDAVFGHPSSWVGANAPGE